MRGQGVVAGDHIVIPCEERERREGAADSHAPWRAAYGRLGKYRFVGASAIGKWHRHEGRPRDDAFAVHAAGVWLAVAVSDGVSSRLSSRYGASFAVQTLCERLLQEALGIFSQEPPQTDVSSPLEEEPAQEESPSCPLCGSTTSRALSKTEEPKTEEPVPLLSCADTLPIKEQANAWSTWSVYDLSLVRSVSEGMATEASQPSSVSEEAVRRAFRHTRGDLQQFADKHGFSLQDLHCTLLGLVLNTETGAFAVGQIGDGVIAALHPDHGARRLVEAPMPPEAGQTYVLTQSQWETYLDVKAYPSEEAEGWTTFYLMTDGVADDCIYPPPEGIFERWARDMDREVRKEGLPQTACRLLHWLATYERRGSWDDRTLVVVFRE